MRQFGLMTALLLAMAAPAWAAEANVVVGVDFDGDVQDAAQLRSLLTIKEGSPYDPAAVRASMDLFYQTGRYDGISVDTDAVTGGQRLRFHFTRQALITEWRFDGNRHLGNDQLQRALELRWGDDLSPGRFPILQRAVHDRYLREGYPKAKATFTSEPVGPGAARLVVAIDEGEPVRIAAVKLVRTGSQTGAADVGKAFTMKAGDVLRREDVVLGLERVEKRLTNTGFLNSRVGYSFELPDGTRETNFNALMQKAPPDATLVVSLEAGQQAVVKVQAHPLLGTHDMAQAITVYKNRSYSPFELDESAARLRQVYVSQGYGDAVVTHTVERKPDGNYLITFKVTPGDKRVIKAILFKGNKGVDEGTLRAQLVTRPAGFTEVGAFDPAIWEDDTANLTAFYASQGYLAAKVTGTERTMDPDGSRMTMTVIVDEGPQSLISRLRVLGVTGMQEAGVLQALPVDPGMPYNPRRQAEWISSVQAYFARNGHPLAHVTATYEPVPPTDGKVMGTLRIDVTPGPLKRIGKLVVRGTVKTHLDVVERQLTVKPGQAYDASELFQTQQQIYQLGFFDRVTVEPLNGISARAEDPVDVLVGLHERETGSVAVGGGYNGIGTLQGVEANAEYVENNLFGSGYPLRLEGATGPSRTLATFSLRDPYLWNSTFVGESGFTYRDEIQTATRRVRSWGPSLGLSRQITDRLLGSLRYSWSQVDYLPPSPDGVIDPIDLAAAGGMSQRTDSILTAGISFDSRSDTVNPRWGQKAELSLDFATPLLSGTLVYTRPHATLAQYFPLPRKIVLALGAEGAYIQTLAKTSLLPNDVRFLAGGQNLRGYGYNLVGVPTPSNAACLAGLNSSCVTGGTVELIGHMELRVPVWGDLGVVAFSDVGNVWQDPQSIGVDGIRLTTGLGLRYQTPVGPVRVDYGVRVRPAFELAGWEGLTFGIGQAF
ncbi:MAG: outer membrane protein assembly factor YaeT precursor [Cyanobacteria bacterium RYN_339]|nr:outer membrane protein assembly factor YaeT precursor [Cyanobacteria bacterium RYN_339]